jgi:transposase-like protein/ribosomal protein L37AE/L43A
VARPDFPRSILEFQSRFADEDACRRYLFESRWPEGFSCPRCGGASAGEQPKRRLWECRDCGHQTSVTAGTVMHATRTPLQVWFWAAYLVATHHPGISAVQLQRQLGISRYETAWLILHKLRRAMVAPERSRLRGAVEVDEFYVGGIEQGRGAGRKSDSSKAIVVLAVELRGQGSGRLRLRVVPDLSNTHLCGFVEEAVEPGAVVHTDAWQGYRRLGRLGYDHRPSSQRQAAPGEWLLPRAHRSISNLKAWLHGTHRDVSREHLQVYLDEFVFRHNRRRTPMAAFQTLLGLGADRPPTTYREITTHAA